MPSACASEACLSCPVCSPVRLASPCSSPAACCPCTVNARPRVCKAHSGMRGCWRRLSWPAAHACAQARRPAHARVRSARPALPHHAVQLPHLARALLHIHLPHRAHCRVSRALCARPRASGPCSPFAQSIAGLQRAHLFRQSQAKATQGSMQGAPREPARPAYSAQRHTCRDTSSARLALSLPAKSERLPLGSRA